MTQLCEALKNNDMLRTLILGTNSIGDDGAELLAGYMASEHYPWQSALLILIAWARKLCSSAVDSCWPSALLLKVTRLSQWWTCATH